MSVREESHVNRSLFSKIKKITDPALLAMYDKKNIELDYLEVIEEPIKEEDNKE